MVGEMIIKPVETKYVIWFKKLLDDTGENTGMTICADRAEIKDEHLILYKKDSIVYFCLIERIDSFYAREV